MKIGGFSTPDKFTCIIRYSQHVSAILYDIEVGWKLQYCSVWNWVCGLANIQPDMLECLQSQKYSTPDKLTCIFRITEHVPNIQMVLKLIKKQYYCSIYKWDCGLTYNKNDILKYLKEEDFLNLINQNFRFSEVISDFQKETEVHRWKQYCCVWNGVWGMTNIKPDVQHCLHPSATSMCTQKCQVLPSFDQFYQISHKLQNSYQKLNPIAHSVMEVHPGQKRSVLRHLINGGLLTGIFRFTEQIPNILNGIDVHKKNSTVVFEIEFVGWQTLNLNY